MWSNTRSTISQTPYYKDTRRIAAAGRKFAEEHLTLDAMARYHHALLGGYARLISEHARERLARGDRIDTRFVVDESVRAAKVLRCRRCKPSSYKPDPRGGVT